MFLLPCLPCQDGLYPFKLQAKINSSFLTLLFCHSNKESNGHIVNLWLSSVTRNPQLQVPSFPCLSPCPLPHYHLNFILCRCQLHARYRIRCLEAHTQCGIVFSDDPITFPSFKFKTERKGVFASTENCFSRQGSCWSQKPSQHGLRALPCWQSLLRTHCLWG